MAEFFLIDPNAEPATLFAAVSLASALFRTVRKEEGGKSVSYTVFYYEKSKIVEKLLAGDCLHAWAVPEADGNWTWYLKFTDACLTFALAHSPEWVKATTPGFQ